METSNLLQPVAIDNNKIVKALGQILAEKARDKLKNFDRASLNELEDLCVDGIKAGIDLALWKLAGSMDRGREIHRSPLIEQAILKIVENE